MKRSNGFTKFWFLFVMLALVVSGCGDNNNDYAAPSSANSMTTFSVSGETGTVNESAGTIAVTVPFGTDVTALVADYTASSGDVKVGAVAQTSGVTTNNFTFPVEYTVTAANGTTDIYTATVREALISDKALTAYTLAGVPGTIDEAAKTVTVKVPFGTNVTALIATYSADATDVAVLGLQQVSGTTPNNFTAAVTYTVTAADASTASYIVTVTVALASEKALTAFSLNGVPGIINEGAKTIGMTMPLGTDVTNLVASYTTTATDVKVEAVAQTSGITSNNFTNPVVYTVTANDASTALYTVTVTVAAAPGPVLLGMAGDYAIFANTAISNSAVPSSITGSIGVGPGVTSTAITGFALTLPAASSFATSAQVSEKVYARDYAAPTPTNVNTASLNMGAAYTDAASRIATSAATTNVGAGILTSLTLAPGVYEWGSNVNIPTNLTLSGNSTDIWIFKVGGTLDMAAAKSVLLIGGAQEKNIFWQTSGAVNIGANTHFAGIILSQTAINFGNGSSLTGRMLAQTAVALDATVVTQP